MTICAQAAVTRAPATTNAASRNLVRGKVSASTNGSTAAAWFMGLLDRDRSLPRRYTSDTCAFRKNETVAANGGPGLRRRSERTAHHSRRENSAAEATNSRGSAPDYDVWGDVVALEREYAFDDTRGRDT